MPQIDAPSLGERVGTLAVAVGLTVGEFSLVSASLPWSAPKVEDDMWGHLVSDLVFKNRIFPFSDLNE